MTRTELEWPTGQPVTQTGGVGSLQGIKVGSPVQAWGCLAAAWGGRVPSVSWPGRAVLTRRKAGYGSAGGGNTLLQMTLPADSGATFSMGLSSLPP